ncbi:histidine kinase dimerization/phosphoacceptor domain -containing protein [Deminuibacter soli]|uniref:histidine kinase n=1 Tax=Deminuibacter soli TaxID=2291815 RepID=A0A3E1NE71_9BACT|nr:histidine kinase dimerization/phosphoacceptor domain -containing protein [Deminuibacter soli]RFM26260.1 hypothetical protein DXN05_20325 [Deminuibacter soli]
MIPTMMKFLQLAAVFFFLVISVQAQDITRRQADSLTSSLTGQVADTDRLNTLLRLASFHVHQRHLSDTTINAVNAYITEAQQLNKKLKYPFFNENIQLIRSGLYKAQGNTAAGKTLLARLINQLQDGGDKALLGKAYFDMSEYYSGDFLYETMRTRIEYLQLAIAAFQETTHWVELARCYRFLADLHQMTNDNAAAFAEVRTALKYYGQAGYTENQGALSLLGRIYYEQGDYKQALNYELMALKIATGSSDDNVRLICQINNNIGYTYLKLNENQKALQFFLQALRIAEQEKDNATVYLLAANVADTYLILNEPEQAVNFFHQITRKFEMPSSQKYESGDYGISQTYLKIYLALKQYDKARYYCEQLIKQTQNPNINLFWLSRYYELIARFYIETADYEAAKLYLQKDKDLVSSRNDLSGMAQNYKLWFSLDTASNKYKEAISNLIKSNELKDSILNETKSRQVAQLEVEFETEKKENEIGLLNQKAILENTKLKQADFVKNVTITGVILLLIIAGLLYKQSNLRKKSNVIVTHKNELLQSLLTEKEWLLKEVHHRVKNNLHTVICLLESQARYLEEDALRAIESSQNRIYAMSLIHQKLYQSDDIGTIDLKNYLNELTSYLSDSFGSPMHIGMYLQVDEVKLNLSQAIPLGLIINEAVTNAFKYAFPDKRPGKITIDLKQADNHIKLLISDNGIGMRNSSNGSLPKSLGLDLMRGLTMELQGRIFFENDNGTRVKVIFPIEALSVAVDTTDTHVFHRANMLDI